MSPITADALNGGRKHPAQRRFESALVEDWRRRRWALLLHSEDVLKMEIEEIDVASLRKASDRELLSLHRRTHQLWSKVKPHEKRDGLYLVAPHAQRIWEGKKRLIIKSKKFNVEGKKYYLVQDKVYGVIEMGAPYSINLEEFKKLSKLHLISEKERSEWWPDYKTLYAYAVKKFERFPTPKDYDRVPQAQIFVKDVEPRNKVSRSDIEAAHELIVSEVIRRGMEHKTPLEDKKTKGVAKSVPKGIDAIYNDEYFKGLLSIDTNFIADLAEVNKYLAGESLLEIGCGCGRALKVFEVSGMSIIGVDAASKAIEMCKAAELEARRMDAQYLEFRDGMFDTVFSMHLLEHLEDPIKAITESLRVARKRAIHLVPLGKREDVTHLWEFLSIENLRSFVGDLEVATHFQRIPMTNCGVIVFDKELRGDIPFFNYLDSFTVTPGYVSLGGGSVKKPNPDDLDIIIREEIPDDGLEVALRNLFFDPEIRKRLHFIYHSAGPHDDSIPLMDKVCQLRSDFEINRVDVEKRELKPLTHFKPLKTGRGYTQLEFFAPEELWEKWAKPLMDEGIDIEVERKFGGWRTIAQIDEKGKTYIYFDDTKTDRSKQFMSLVSDLEVIGEPVILDMDLGAVYSDGRPVDRVNLGFGGKVIIPESGKFKIKDGLDAMLVANVFDILYYEGEDLHTKPWEERRESLEKLFGKHDFRFLKLVKKNITSDKKSFLAAVARVSKLPGSEGAVPKAVNGDYPLTGMTPSVAKVKNTLEIKVQVMGRTPVKDEDIWTYDISALGGDGNPVDLGKTMNTKLDTKAGDIITISVQEVIPDWDEEREIWTIAIVIPIPQNIEPGRKKPDTVSEIIVRADKANILQASPAVRDKLRASRISVRKFIEELVDCLDEEKRDALRPQPGSREGLANEVVKYIPEHKTYVEPFAGGGRVLMKKEPSEIEVLSDLDSEVMFMFKAAKSFTKEEIEKLRKMDWTRAESKWLQLKKSKFKDKLREFYRLMYVRRCSFNYDGSAFARNKEGSRLDFGRIEPWFGAKGRLAKVKLLTCDYAIAIKRFDGPETFFHIDPPFIGHTESGGWKKWKGFDFERLFKIVKQIKGKWLLTIDDAKEVRKIFSKYHIKEIKVFKGSQRFSWYGNKIRTELLISNYKLEKAGGGKAEETEKAQKPEAKITIKKGDKGDGILQTHELGLTEDQVKLLGPDFSFGWDPVEISDSQFGRLYEIQDIGWEGLVKKASEGDSSNLGKAINKIDKDELSVSQRKLIALVEPVAIHTDIRLHPKGAPYWEGGEGFTPGNQFQINKFTLLEKDAKVRILMDFKRPRKGTGRVETIRGPLIWLKVGLKKPQSFPPGSVGSTAKAWARFTIRDLFDWEAGTQEPHYKEFKFDDGVLKGRHIMAFAPLPGREQRMWLFSRPGKQEMDEEGKSIVKILKVDEEKRTVLGVVLEPETFDAQDEIVSAPVIEKTAHDFLANYNQKTKLGYMHTFFEPDLQLYECYVAPIDMVIEGTRVKKGSWLMLSKVNDDHIWQQVKDKKIKGYSIAGIAIARTIG